MGSWCRCHEPTVAFGLNVGEMNTTFRLPLSRLGPEAIAAVDLARKQVKNAVQQLPTDEENRACLDSLQILRRACGQGGEDNGRQMPGPSLDLPFCKWTVETHGGPIRAESDGPGHRLNFTFTNPPPSCKSQYLFTIPSGRSLAPNMACFIRVRHVSSRGLRAVVLGLDRLLRLCIRPQESSDNPVQLHSLSLPTRPSLSTRVLLKPGQELVSGVRCCIASVCIVTVILEGTSSPRIRLETMDFAVTRQLYVQLHHVIRSRICIIFSKESDEGKANT